ncbi:MAG TPA: AraC family transcriptional regulator [Phototrophicaceae bacterium]|nr:AraC family transcriptional regulator [Phototrophicaceae bacterium]
MTIAFEERLSDSPYIENVIRGRTLKKDAPIRPATSHWHMVFVRYRGVLRALAVGPCSTSGRAFWDAGAELLWIRFRLGTFMPHLPVKRYLDLETEMPEAVGKFWLKGSAWEYPDFDNAETFVERLVRDEILLRDPLVCAALDDQLPEDTSPRTVRHRFLQATGVTQGHIRQMKRAQQAQALLLQGMSILDVVEEAGYFDQAHLTRSLRLFVGHTPAQISRMSDPACHSVQDSDSPLDYHTNVLEIAR